MIRRLLIANRGEIAVRIARACREMGVESVAIYSDQDSQAAHVAAADRAVRVGPAPPLESYLNIDAVLQAARETGADALHPGYGFLSENPAFADACRNAGITFVGPPPEAIRSMGSKIGARRLVEAAGVPIVPGHTPADQTDEGVASAIQAIGVPALIKASAGGGGRGMRVVSDQAQAGASIQAARREAQAAFRDGTLYVERLIAQAHHIEVQVFADQSGHVVHLFERECSVQRRHQKIIEESPSPNVTPALRRRITEAAVRAARAAGYVNAGTFEFLVDLGGGRRDDAPFYFLETNTRLQVEHPVTEEVTGVDLVHAQLLVASGAPVPWAQDSLTQRGHSIEARVYAEDPSRDFLPQAGQLLLYREPRMPGVRIDSGVREGDTVGVHYDALIAKVIASAETRDCAIERLLAALRAFPVLGIRTNMPFLIRVLDDRRFREGRVHTDWLDTDGSALATEPDSAFPEWMSAVLDASDGARSASAATTWDPWTRVRGWDIR